MFHTYIHQRLTDQKVFYVGKGSLHRAYSRDHRNRHWRAVVAKHGYVVTLCSIWGTEKEAFDHERFLIGCFRSMGHPLTNMTDGGEGIVGVVCTPETRAKISAAKLAWTAEQKERQLAALRSPEVRAKISAAGKGRKLSAEHIAKTMAKQTGRKMSQETKDRIAATKRGRTLSAVTRRKMSIARTGQKRTAEQRATMSAAQRGRVVSEETRAKIAAGHKAHWDALKENR